MEIITEGYVAPQEEMAANLEKLEKAEAEKKIKLQKSYDKQLAEFIEDESYFKDYPEKVRKDKHVLLRMFKFEPDKEFWESMTLQVPLVKTQSIINEVVSIDYTITNIAKVIKAGPNAEYKAGDIVYLPYQRVQGVMENPKWQDYKQSQLMQGATPIEPDDKRKLIPAVEQNYAQCAYKKPGNAEMDDDDRITFCMVDYEIVTSR